MSISGCAGEAKFKNFTIKQQIAKNTNILSGRPWNYILIQFEHIIKTFKENIQKIQLTDIE